MKRTPQLTLIFILLAWLTGAQSVFAQYGSEWIVPGQTYVKAQVVDTAIYQIPLTQLSALGLNTSDPTKIQVWRRGVEQSVRIANSTLYFVGYSNDGTTDSLLYQPSSNQPNKYYSIYTDSAAYFITVGTANGKRWGTTAGSVSTGPSSYRLRTALFLYTSEYDRGKEYQPETRLSWGDNGEGWVGPMIYSANGNIASSQQNLALPGFTSLGPTLEVEVQVIGRNFGPHEVKIDIGGNISTIPVFMERGVRTVNVTIPSSSVSAGVLNVTVSTQGSITNPLAPDAVGIAYIKVIYPQSNAVSGSFQEWGNPVSTGDSYQVLSGAVSTAQVLDLTQLSDINVVPSVFSAGNLQIALPSTAKNLLYHDGVTFANVAALRRADLNIYAANAEYLIITHWKLWQGATQYAAYRASNAGGAYSVLLTDVNKLYDLYSYGDKSSIAIRRFCEYQIAVGNPRFLFIIGKGLYIDYQYLHADGSFPYYRKDPNGSINNPNIYWNIEDLVPTYGAPASDIMFSEGLDGRARYVPALATGRYTGRTNQSVLDYLDKVQANDTLSEHWLWRKNFVHMSGGRDAAEINHFRNVVNGFAAIAEGEWFGGNLVITFSKSVSSGSVDQFLKYSLVDEVNKGLNMVTFFGHSSASVTDVEIGMPSDPLLGYANEGKYPLLLVNGCMSAASFYSYSFAEDWIVTPKKGAIAVMGHADVGYSQTLNRYSTAFYLKNFADYDYIDKTIGEVQQAAIDTFMQFADIDPNSPYSISTTTQFMLYADPAVKIYKPAKPDYHISGDAEYGPQKAFIYSYQPFTKVTADADSFAIGIPVINFGITNPDSVSIHVKRVINNNTTIDYDVQLIGPVNNNDTVYFKIKDKNPAYLGINYFEIRIDYLGRIDELNENNNLATLNYYMPAAGVLCLLPKEFSIVYTNPAVTLVAQTSDLLVSNTDFFLEFDTTSTFTSPARMSTIKNSNSLIRWDVSTFTDLLPSDSVVYYWRVRFNTIAPGQDTIWGTSSFIYIKPSEPGWSQSEVAQFPKDGMNGIHQNPTTGAWEFNNTDQSLYLRVGGNPNGGSMQYEYSSVLKLGNLILLKDQYDACGNTGMVVVVLDKTTVNYKFPQPKVACGYNFRPYVVNFNNLTAYDDGDHSDANYDQVDMINYLNAVDPGDYVLIFNMGNGYYNSWDPTLRNLLISDYGAQQLGFLSDNMPYYMLSKKGATAPLFENYAPQLDGLIYLTTQLNGTQNTGYITSTMIGPVTDIWETMYRNVKLEDAQDGYEISIIVHNLSEVPIDTISIPQKDTLDLSTLIDFQQYPFIKLLATVYDSLNLTPPQLKRWQVIYKPAPEGVYNTALVTATEYLPKVKQEGETFTINYVFENITTYDFVDSMRVQFSIINNGTIVRTELITIGSKLLAGQKVNFSYVVNTSGLVGDNVIRAYVNPKLQPEQYYTNNIMEVAFNVQQDKTNPVLDVTFDGVHILDGDVVSPSPQISIIVNDNNQLLLMDDSTNVNLFLIRPGSTTAEPIYKSNLDVKQWGQDPGAGNKLSVLYHPENLPDGVYTIVVQGIDKSGNKAGTNTYRIRFEVVNKSTITHFYPYPNPFSTSCRFVFTLTGGVIPEDMTIQIMTVTGKVVKEITLADIGNVHAGNNITEYAWDGRDTYGDRLANGVYLYRVIIKNPGSNFEHRETSGDQAFKKDFGKLYILR